MPEGFEEAPLNPTTVGGVGYRRLIVASFGGPRGLAFRTCACGNTKKKRKDGLVPDDQVESSLDRYKFEQVAASMDGLNRRCSIRV